MAIKDLQARQGQVDLIAEIIEKGDIREFEKFGKKGRVCNAKIKDDTGEMTLTLWNEQIDQVQTGNKVHITNGWVGEWQGEKQLSTGKFGKLEVVEGGSEGEKTPDKGMESSEEEKNPADEKLKEELEENIVMDEEEIK
ncbi:hypothetical protein KY358_02670 [Candidatus Woesearchaeota archaeon]|nr:hypothetical protein [Candidatus Woesearchaeota archaeon]